MFYPHEKTYDEPDNIFCDLILQDMYIYVQIQVYEMKLSNSNIEIQYEKRSAI